MPVAFLLRAVVVAAAFGLLGFAVIDAHAEGATTSRSIAVSGTGDVTASPDMATIFTGVVSEAETAAAALADNNDRADAMIAALKAAGVDAADIQTTRFAVEPQIVYPDGSRAAAEAPRIVGYRVTNDVQVTVRDLAALGGLLDTLVGAGSNRINGLNFGVSNAAALSEKAEELAVADALARAKRMAVAADQSLGPILAITDQMGGGPQPYARAAIENAASAVPIAEGTIKVSATVQVTVELAD